MKCISDTVPGLLDCPCCLADAVARNDERKQRLGGDGGNKSFGAWLRKNRPELYAESLKILKEQA